MDVSFSLLLIGIYAQVLTFVRVCAKNSWKFTKYIKDSNDMSYNLISTHQRYNHNSIELN